MGWRGALRSMAAAQRRAERESMRYHRELEKLAKMEAKLQVLQAAANEVEVYENLIQRIRSVHRECGKSWNWSEVAATPQPKEPVPNIERGRAAQLAVDRYEPNFFIKLFGLVGWRLRALKIEADAARESDKQANDRDRAEYQERYGDWKEAKELAERMLRRDPSAFREALEEVQPLVELSELGSRIVFSFTNDGRATVTLHVNGESVVPDEVKTLLQSGKLSAKKMPQGQFYEIYQDYVCGAVFRVARELFALLPLDTIAITAMSHMLDTSTGHMTDQPILSVLMRRSTMDALKFDTMDPSDALRNFIHRMNFRKTKGFVRIDALTLDAVAA